MHKLLRKFLPLVAVLGVLAFPAFAFGESNQLDIQRYSIDGKLEISSSESIKALYIRFDREPGRWTLSTETGKEFAAGTKGFLHEYIDVEEAFGSGASKLVLSLPSGVKIDDIYAFDGQDVPHWVQRWEEPCEKADFMLISTHADDEQLFFAGVLPYYSQVRKLEVQVVYATDHNAQPGRHHERLDGLWTVGIRHYPVSMGIEDAYSESYEGALAGAAACGFTEEDIVALHKEMISRFQPQVIATHDVAGEYGHGQHILVNGTLQKALNAPETDFSFLKKVYFHLYEENPVKLEFLDETFEALDGLTPFQVTQKGFDCHKSQHWTWFKKWILGAGGEISKASQIKTYSPMDYGLFYGDASLDVNKNDFFEGLTSYEEQRLEAERLAEEQRLKEEEEARLKAEAIEARIRAEKKRNIMISVGAAAAVIFVLGLLIARRKKYKGRH